MTACSSATHLSNSHLYLAMPPTMAPQLPVSPAIPLPWSTTAYLHGCTYAIAPQPPLFDCAYATVPCHHLYPSCIHLTVCNCLSPSCLRVAPPLCSCLSPNCLYAVCVICSCLSPNYLCTTPCNRQCLGCPNYIHIMIPQPPVSDHVFVTSHSCTSYSVTTPRILHTP